MVFPLFHRLNTFPFLASAILCLSPWALRAEVDMQTAVCATGSDNLGLAYKNLTPDPWDMRGYGMTIGAGTVTGKFATQASGGFLVPPGATAEVLFASCDGNTGSPKHRQLRAKVGSCNEPAPPSATPSWTCAEVSTPSSYYNSTQCLMDGLGINLGTGYGGFLDSYAEQSQIQITVPDAVINLNGAMVRFDPASMGGPFYPMSMVALQEFLHVDAQFLFALGATSSGAGLVNASSGASLYVSPANSGTDQGQYGSFNIVYQTAMGRLFADYPKYFSGNPALGQLVSTGGSGPTLANSPQQLNSGFLAVMNLWWLFDGLKAAQDLCFSQFIKDAADKSAALKLLLGGYFIGPNTVDNGTGANDDFATHILPTTNSAILGAADVTPYMKKFVWDKTGPDFNTHNHIARVFSVLYPIAGVNPLSNACGGARPIYDAGVTLQQVQELFFGQGGTVASQGGGGLLWHFKISADSRQGLWTDLICTFEKLKGKAPGRTAAEISFRYDFLNLLGVARRHFAGYLNKWSDRPMPLDSFSSEWSIWVFNHSRFPCVRSIPDTSFPVLATADAALKKGEKVEKSSSDNFGIRSRQFTTDKNWRQWQATDAAFTVPATLANTDRLWYQVIDSCGNAVIEEVALADGPTRAEMPMNEITPNMQFGRGTVKFSSDRMPRSIACYDALGVFAGWARPTAEPATWSLPEKKGPILLEIRWADGSRSRLKTR